MSEPTWKARAAELAGEVAVGPRPRRPDWQVSVDLRCCRGQENPRIPAGLPDSVILGVEYHSRDRGWEQHDFFLDSEQARTLGRALIERADLIDLAESQERITRAKDPTP